MGGQNGSHTCSGGNDENTEGLLVVKEVVDLEVVVEVGHNGGGGGLNGGRGAKIFSFNAGGGTSYIHPQVKILV